MLLLVLAYFVGSFFEKRHFRSIREREAATQSFPNAEFSYCDV